LRPYDKSLEVSYEDTPKVYKNRFKNKEEHDTHGMERLIQNLICEGIDCTYKKVKTRVMLSPNDTRKQIKPKIVKEYYYHEGKKVKEVDYLDE
jgi:hypothetical protein